jgi:TetR/AcrR family transcriptional regulator, regulator of autoinduction and epiphytic fitness
MNGPDTIARDMAAVKTKTTNRREQAIATRRRIVDAGYRLFADDGYASATMDAIAAEAGVAVQTVYHVFNTKSVLLREVIQVAAAGQHDPPPEPAWMQEALEATDGRRGLAVMIEHGIGSSARVAPLIAAIHAATSADPSFADYWDASCEMRRTGTAALAARLAARRQLRAGLSTRRAADILYAIGSHEMLSAFLTTCGWSLEEVKAWHYELACGQLLSDQARSGPDVRPERPTRGLSFDGIVSG